jgi:flagellum-specific ATP synthase
MTNLHPLVRAAAGAELVARTGCVVAVRGQIVESAGPVAQVGERCCIEAAAPHPLEAEVIGFSRGNTILMPFGSVEGIAAGGQVVAQGRMPEIPVGEVFLGRVIDAFGSSLDGRDLVSTGVFRRLRTGPPHVLRRQRVDAVLETGIKVIDSMLTLARGQRIGLFAGSGVGKSTLMGMMVRGTQVDVNVIALIGERSREVREFVEDQLGEEGLRRSVVVVATASEPAVTRIRAAYAATAMAEFFRDQGKSVLLMMDSLTRFATARREVGLAVGEPPTSRGYTPSVFAELPQLCERSGPGVDAGSITGVYTVLVEGDDLNEPVSDTLRATLDGHIVLSRDVANMGHYPAVDILRSVSRLHAVLSKPADLAAARKLLACCALFERNRQLVEIGAYKPGVSPALDQAVAAMPLIHGFFSQQTGQIARRADSLAELRKLADQMGDFR